MTRPSLSPSPRLVVVVAGRVRRVIHGAGTLENTISSGRWNGRRVPTLEVVLEVCVVVV